MTLKDDFSAIFSASNAIPQGLSQIKQHSPSWRYLLQTIRNASANRNPGDYDLARIYQASLPISQVSPTDPHAEQKERLIRLISGRSTQFSITSMPNDVVPYKDGDFLTGGLVASELPADGDSVEVILPPIRDDKGVICLGEWDFA